MNKSMHALPPHYASINDRPVARRSSAFDFRTGSDVCPTCGGTGKVSKGQQEELVALIPYKDKRLKPRRTCLIVVMFLLIIIVMVTTATLLAVFLSPRDVTFSCSKVLVTNWTDIRPPDDSDEEEEEDDEARKDAYMTLQIHGIAKNNNYASIEIKSIEVMVSRNELTVGHATHQQVSVGVRQHKEIIIVVNATYTGPEAVKVRASCATWKTISVEIMLVSTYSYLSHTSNTDDLSHHYLPCGSLN